MRYDFGGSWDVGDADNAARIVKRVAERLAAVGLDIVHPFDVAQYNRHIADHATLAPLPDFNRGGALAVLIGASRALWPAFLAAYRRRPELQASPDPLDEYVTAAVTDCAKRITKPTAVRLAHVSGPDLVSMLHVAEASGFAHVGPVHLAIHETLGPWLSLRAVITVDAAPPATQSMPAPDPCSGCNAPCEVAMAQALTADAPTQDADIATSWRAWLAVRDACPVGIKGRYGASQIRYHYTKDRAELPTTVEETG